jgi:hypothetical protein
LLLPRYHFEHPNTENGRSFGRWAYLWAGLFGVVFVWWAGAGNLVYALTVNVVFAGVTFMALSLTSFLPSPLSSILLVVAPPIIVFIQGVIMISIVRTGYRRRGWLIRTD